MYMNSVYRKYDGDELPIELMGGRPVIERRICVTRETRAALIRAFNVTSRMVFNALTFASNSMLAERIRRRAIELDGYVRVSIPEMDTLHDNDGYMRQYFPNGAMLELEKSTGNAWIYDRDGNVVQNRRLNHIPEIVGFQNIAKGL